MALTQKRPCLSLSFKPLEEEKKSQSLMLSFSLIRGYWDFLNVCVVWNSFLLLACRRADQTCLWIFESFFLLTLTSLNWRQWAHVMAFWLGPTITQLVWLVGIRWDKLRDKKDQCSQQRRFKQCSSLCYLLLGALILLTFLVLNRCWILKK